MAKTITLCARQQHLAWGCPDYSVTLSRARSASILGWHDIAFLPGRALVGVLTCAEIPLRQRAKPSESN